jgi:hypothetical protein
MKNERTCWMIFTTMVAAGLVACSPGPDRRAEQPAVPDLEQARAKFQDSAEEQMQALKDEMNRLRDQVGDIDELPDVQVRIEQWERGYQELEEKLESKEAATLDEWRTFESEVNTALARLRASYDELASDLRASLGSGTGSVGGNGPGLSRRPGRRLVPLEGSVQSPVRGLDEKWTGGFGAAVAGGVFIR